jgi:DNA polymerase (family 10)
VLIELNANPWRMDMDWRYWRQAAEMGIPCVITADAHDGGDLDYLRGGILAARKAGLRPEDLFNSASLKDVKERLEAARASGR